MNAMPCLHLFAWLCVLCTLALLHEHNILVISYGL